MSFFDNAKAVTFAEKAVAKLELVGKKIWEAIKFTNQVPISTDTDGSIYNKVGYKDNTRLSSSGGVSGSAQTGSVTTGFIPWYGVTTYLRIKGVEWLNAEDTYGGHYYINFYKADKTLQTSGVYLYSGDTSRHSHVVTITRDANGVETVKFNETYGAANSLLNTAKEAKFIRINAYGKGANMIVTINEEIT
jgi:hypothetical protein